MLSAIGKKADPIMTQIEMLKTRPVLEKTIEKLQLTDKTGKTPSSGALAGMLGFSVVTNTNIIQLTCKNGDPKQAAEILNTLSDIYIEVNRDINRASATAAREFIEKQVAAQKQQLDSAENALARYKSKTGTVSLEQETQLKIGGIAQLESELVKVEAELQGIKSEIRAFEIKTDEPGARNSSKFTQWQAALEEAQRSLSISEALRNRLQTKIASENSSLNRLPKQEIAFANLVRDTEIAKQIYAGLLENHEQFKIREASNTSTIKMVEPAVIPDEPIEPQKKKILMLAVIAGFMVGFGISLLLEYLDDTPRSLDELKRILNRNLLGAIPYMKKMAPLYTRESSDSIASESLRLIHTNMKFTGLLTKKHNAIMLTSSQPGEGKTTTSVNLAVTYAELGSKTAVVNIDLRRPSFHKMLDWDFKLGVTDYLIGDASYEQIAYTGSIPNLTVIPAGTVPPNPAVLIGTQKMVELIKKLKNDFDVVLFDTPPITMVAETLDIARAMDGVLLLVDMADSSTRAIRHMAGLLEGKDLPILGFIVNKAGKSGIGQYGKYGYSYAFDK